MTNEKQPTLEELVLIMNYSPNQETRNKAREKVIDNYVQRGWYKDLVRMSQDRGIPKTLRNKAGEKIELTGEKVIDNYVQNGWYNYLVDISKNKDIPETLRNKAGEKIKECTLNLTSKYNL